MKRSRALWVTAVLLICLGLPAYFGITTILAVKNFEPKFRREIGTTTSELLSDIGPPSNRSSADELHAAGGIESIAGGAVYAPWPTRKVTGELWLYVWADRAAFVFIDVRGRVEAVEFGAG